MFWRSIILAAAGLVYFATPAYTAIITVYNTNDALAGSLRQAIQDATPGDTIVFHIPTTDPRYNTTSGVFSVSLTSGELSIAKSLTIDAIGQRITVQRTGAARFRIFNVSAGAVVISGLTITNGDPATTPGGGLYNAATLTVRACTISGNGGWHEGAGIYNASGGNLTVENCTLTNNRSTVAAADASGHGAGISNHGVLAVRTSTIAGNSATPPGCGSTCTGFGGGIYNPSGATAVIRSTIIANNIGLTQSPNVFGNFTSEGYNLIGNGAGSTGFTATGDQVGASAGQVNLGPLQDNGGPTHTMRPLTGSLAIDQGKRGVDANNQPINTDQRGSPRPVDLAGIPNAVGGDGSDIGAVETGLAQSGPNFTVTNNGNHNDNVCSRDDCTLLEAIAAANANGDASEINFAANVTGTISQDFLHITAPLMIHGPGARFLKISGGNVTVFEISSGIPATIEGLTIANGDATFTNGGGVLNQGVLTLRNCTIRDNIAYFDSTFGGGNGGGVMNVAGATLTIDRCSFINNIAQQFGGGVYSDGILTLTNCTFYNNTALRGGGVISRAAGGAAMMTLRNCTIAGNAATDGVNMPGFGGGGVFAEGGAQQYFATNNIIAGNSSTNDPDIRGNYTSQGNNLIGKAGDSVGFSNGVNGDKVGTVASPISAQFNLFTDNGGPTDTWSILGTSPARDAGNNANAPSADQRGYSRSGVSDMGAFEFNGAPPPLVPIVNVVSTKVHGAQTFGINLPPTGSPGVECRTGGAHGDFTIVFNFVNPLTLVGGASVTSGAATIVPFAGINTSDAHQYIVQLTGVVNAQVVMLQLTNVNDSLGNNTPVLQVPIGFLLGDTTGNGSVTASDVSQAKLQSGQALSGSNFRSDINVNGSINATDVSSVKLRTGTALP